MVLRGRFYAIRQNKADNETAIAMLERSVATDPTFALAYAELAQAYVWRCFLFTPGEKDWGEKAFVAVEKALSLDPSLAEAYLARGRLLWTPANHFPHEKAIQEYGRALTLNPNLDEAQNQLALDPRAISDRTNAPIPGQTRAGSHRFEADSQRSQSGACRAQYSDGFVASRKKR